MLLKKDTNFLSWLVKYSFILRDSSLRNWFMCWVVAKGDVMGLWFIPARMLGDSMIPLPHIYGARIKGVEVFCPLDPPPPYEAVAAETVTQVHTTYTWVLQNNHSEVFNKSQFFLETLLINMLELEFLHVPLHCPSLYKLTERQNKNVFMVPFLTNVCSCFTVLTVWCSMSVVGATNRSDWAFSESGCLTCCRWDFR